jgi:hypothetical protein
VRSEGKKCAILFAVKPGGSVMRIDLIRAKLIRCGLAAGLAAAALFATPLFVSPLLVTPLSAQERQQPINPEDELAPGQIKQPMPTPVPAPTGKPSNQPSNKPGQRTAAATRGAVRELPPTGKYRTVVECSGPFAKDSGMLALAVAYDSRNMIFTHETVQGTQVGATVLFPKDPRRRLEVWWQNPNRTGTYLIDIAGKSMWTAPKGLRLALTLEQLEKLNKKPFKLSGFDSNDVASVTDWDGGELAALPGGCKAGVSLHATVKTADNELPAKDQYSSDDPAMRALKPTVSEILIGY